MKTISLWSILADFPPYKVRICAKRAPSETGSPAIHLADIVAMTGMTAQRVHEISTALDWENVTISEMRLFFAACNFDPTNPKCRNRIQQYEYICKRRQARPFQYLRNSPRWESEFLPLLRLMKQQTAPSPVSESARPPEQKSAA